MPFSHPQHEEEKGGGNHGLHHHHAPPITHGCHHPPPSPLYSTDIMSSKRGRGGTTGAKFRMTLGLPVAAVINCAGEWVLGVSEMDVRGDRCAVCLWLREKEGEREKTKLCLRVSVWRAALYLFSSQGKSECHCRPSVYVRWEA